MARLADVSYLDLRGRNMAETDRLDETAQQPRIERRVQLTDVSGHAPVFEGTDVSVQQLVDYLEQVYNLYAFLEDYPKISAEQALAGILLEAMTYESAYLGQTTQHCRTVAGKRPFRPMSRNPSRPSYTKRHGWVIPRPCGHISLQLEQTRTPARPTGLAGPQCTRQHGESIRGRRGC